MANQNMTPEAQVPSTTSLDLPPALASILAMGSPLAPTAPMTAAAVPAQVQAPTTLGAAMSVPSPGALPSFQEGGMIGPGGMPTPTAAPAAPMGAADRDAMLTQSMSQNPQVAQEIQAALMEGLQTGEITPQELNMMVQLIQVASQNPDMYPYVRQFAIQQGIATEADLPAQYDEGLMVALLTVAKAAQQMIQGGGNMMGGEMPAAPVSGQLEGTMPSMAKGGPIKGKADSPVPIMAHEGEYVIPKNVVQMKGREFFDRLVEQYKGKA